MQPFLHKLKDKFGHALLLVPWLLALAWFFALERIVNIPHFYVDTPIDRAIPFLKLFVIPYVLWYLYVALPLVYFFFKSPEDFKKLALFLIMGMGIACYIFTVLPNGQLLRPSNTGGDPLGRILARIYQADTPTNSLPSIHVIYSIGVHLSLMQYKGREMAKFLRPSFILMVLICLSTVFVKQHSILDVFAGIAVASFINAFVYRKQHMGIALSKPGYGKLVDFKNKQ